MIAAAPDAPAEPEETGYVVHQAEGIQWRVYLRVALPLAALTGFITALFFPAVIVALPLSFRRTISQYRPFHSGPLPSRQGVRLGAVMALLSFAAFLIFFVPLIVFQHDAVVDLIRAVATQYPDLQWQQAVLWLATPSGFVAFGAFAVGFVLFLMLMVGLLCGALMTGKSSDRP